MGNFFILIILTLTSELIYCYEKENFQSMLDQLKESYSFLNIMDLSAFKDIDSNAKNQLIEVLNEKRFAGSVKWHPEFESAEFKEKVEKILIENFNNYTKLKIDHSNVCYIDSNRKAYPDIFNRECKIGNTGNHGKIQTNLPEFTSALYVERIEKINQLFSLINFEQFVWIHAEHAGMGKSTLALKYAHESESNRIIRWINSESLFKILEELSIMARDIGEEPRMTIDHMVDAITHFIRQHKSIDYLFIFDNIVELDEEMVIMFDKLRINKNIKFLITTQKNLELYKTNIFTDQNKLTLSNFGVSEQITYGKMFIEKYLEKELNEEEIERFMSNDECMENQMTPYKLNLFRMNLIETPTKEYFKAICNKSTELTTAYSLLSHIKNYNPKDEWDILQYAAFLDSDFINLDIFENVLVKTKFDLIVAIKSLEQLGLVSLQMKYNTVGIRIFHKNFQQETIRFMEQCTSNCLRKKEIIFNLARTMNKLIPDLADTNNYFSLLEYGVHFRFKNLRESYSTYLNPAYVQKSEALKQNISIIESYLMNYNKVFAMLSEIRMQLTVDEMIYMDINLFIKKFKQILCYHMEGMDINNFVLMKLMKHFTDYQNTFYLLDFVRWTTLGDGLWFLSCPHQLVWKTMSFFTLGLI